MKPFVLLALLLVPLVAQAQEEWVSSPNSYAWNPLAVVPLNGNLYYADFRALWVTDASNAGPESWVVADTLTGVFGDGCYDTDGPPIALDGALYLVRYYQDCSSPSLWRYRPGERIERVGPAPRGVRDLTIIDGRFFASGIDDTNRSAFFELLPGEGSYRAILEAEEGMRSMFIGRLIVVEGSIYFTGRGPRGGERIWQYDPATDEARPIDAYGPRWAVSSKGPLVSFNGQVFFISFLVGAADRRAGLWALDPATNHTELVAPFSIEEAEVASNFLVHDNKLFFQSFRSDGLNIRMYDPVADTLTSVGWPGSQFGAASKTGEQLVFDGPLDRTSYAYCLYDDPLRCLPVDPDVRYGRPFVLGDAIWSRACSDGECTYVRLDMEAFEPVPEAAVSH